MAAYFEKAFAKNTKTAKTIANFLIVEVNGYRNKNGVSMKEFPLPEDTLADIASLQEDGYTHKQCIQIFNDVIENGGSAEEARLRIKIEKQASDDGLVRGFVTEVLNANPQSIEDYKAGKDRAQGFLIGQVMKLAKGKVNPASVAKIMVEELAKR